MLREKYHWEEQAAEQMSAFLSPMLELLPVDRANPGGMSNHAFLDGTRGMEGVRSKEVVGSKGEGIDGWEREVEKRK